MPSLIKSFNIGDAFPAHHYRLQNGLEFFMIENALAPVLSLRITYNIGSAQELDSERGLAHFFEHMMFRETANLEDGQFDKRISAMGGVGLNAFTSYDYTAYHVSIPSSHLDELLYLEAERMANLHLKEDQLNAERGAVLGELAMYKNMPSEELWQALMENCFPQHNYRHPIIGYEDQLNQFKTQHFKQFYQSHYAPNNACIVICGDFIHEQVIDLISKHFAPIPASTSLADVNAGITGFSATDTIYIQSPQTSLTAVFTACTIPKADHDDIPALLALSDYLSSGRSAPFYKQLVQSGLCTRSASTLYGVESILKSPGLFLIDYSMPNLEQHAEVEQKIIAMFEAVATNGIPDEQFERIVNMFKMDAYSSLSSSMSIVHNLSDVHVTGYEPLYELNLLQKIEQLNPSDIQSVARKYWLDAPRLSVVQSPS